MGKVTFGVIVGNRGFFPDILAKEGRKDILEVLKNNGYGAVALPMTDTKYGAVETFEDADKCAELFALQGQEIDGIIVTLPNFGDERGITETIKRSGLDVPILVQAEQDVAGQMKIDRRRDSFCGKISVCNNLRQAGIPFTPDPLAHGVRSPRPSSKRTSTALPRSAGSCGASRTFASGPSAARPAAFNTVRYSEKILESAGIGIEPVDLYEILGKVGRLADNDRKVKAKLSAITQYTDTQAIPAEGLLKMAKFGAVVDGWMKEKQLAGHRDSVLDGPGGVLRHRAVHADEHDEPVAAAQRLRGRCDGPAGHVHPAIGQRHAQCACWTGTTTSQRTRTSASCSIAATCPRASSRPTRWTTRRSSPARWARRTPTARSSAGSRPSPATFCRTMTDDVDGILRAYVGEGQFTDDDARHLRRLRRDADREPPDAAELHLPDGLRASRGGEPVADGRRRSPRP